MEFVILMIVVIVVVKVASAFLGGESRKPADRPSPTGKTRKDSWPAPRRAAAARSATQRSTTTQEVPASPPQQPSDSEQQARDPEIWETLSYSKSGESRRGPAGRDSVVPEFRFGGLRDDVTERGEFREQLHAQYREDDADDAESAASPASPAASAASAASATSAAHAASDSPAAHASPAEPEPEPERDLVREPGPEPAPQFGTTGTADVDLGTTPSGARPSSSEYAYSSIGSVYTSTSVYSSSSVLDPDSAEPAEAVDGPEDVGEAEGETGDATKGDRPAGS